MILGADLLYVTAIVQVLLTHAHAATFLPSFAGGLGEMLNATLSCIDQDFVEVLKVLLAPDGVFLYAHQMRQSVSCCPALCKRGAH